MAQDISISPIAHIKNDFATKFGVPRQSGLAADMVSAIVFEPRYRREEALRGMDGFSHLWLIWQFSQAVSDSWSPTVRPPRLGGNVRLGVFATRSPFRPNSLGLSCVKLLGIDYDGPEAPVILVSGADLVDGTPIFDIKPYVPYCDCQKDATGGFASDAPEPLEVSFPKELLALVPEAKRRGLIQVLSLDPRPQYQNDKDRVYGMEFGGLDIRFTVGDRVITVTEVKKTI